MQEEKETKKIMQNLEMEGNHSTDYHCYTKTISNQPPKDHKIPKGM